MYYPRTIGIFTGHMNNKTRELLYDKDNLISEIYIKESFEIDESVPDYYVSVNGKLIRMFKFRYYCWFKFKDFINPTPQTKPGE